MERCPPPLLPVIHSGLGEIAGLGFIGLLLPVIENSFETQLHQLGHDVFGTGEMVVEAFEWYHIKFFQIATIYFLYNGLLLVLLVKDMKGLTKKIKSADKDNDGEVTLDEFEKAFGKGSLEQPSLLARLKTFNLGLSLADTQITVGRFVTMNKLSLKEFSPTLYVESIAAANLEIMVEFSPLLWLMVLPPLASLEQIKLANHAPLDDGLEVVAGMYLKSPTLMVTSLGIYVLAMLWGAYNYAMVYQIGKMTAARIEYSGKGTMLYGKGKMYDPGAVEAWLAEHKLLMRVTWLMTWVFCGVVGQGKVEHVHHRLFGLAGDKGPDLLLNSVKYLTFIFVTAASLITFTILIPSGQAIFIALLSPDLDVSNGVHEGPDFWFVVAEFLIFLVGDICVLLMLFVLTPATLSKLNVAGGTEGFYLEDAVEYAMKTEAERHGEAHVSASKKTFGGDRRDPGEVNKEMDESGSPISPSSRATASGRLASQRPSRESTGADPSVPPPGRETAMSDNLAPPPPVGAQASGKEML